MADLVHSGDLQVLCALEHTTTLAKSACVCACPNWAELFIYYTHNFQKKNYTTRTTNVCFICVVF